MTMIIVFPIMMEQEPIEGEILPPPTLESDFGIEFCSLRYAKVIDQDGFVLWEVASFVFGGQR